MTDTTPQESWRNRLYKLDIADPNSRGCTITLGEYLRLDCPELEEFISSERTRLLGEVRELIKNGDITKYQPHGSNIAGVIGKKSDWFLSQKDLLQALSKLEWTQTSERSTTPLVDKFVSCH